MIKHIVIWTLKDFAEGASRPENAQKMKNLLEALKEKISEIMHIEVVTDIFQSDPPSDIILYSEFRSRDALERYQNHPEHLKVVEFVKSVALERRVVDYETVD